ncbi:36761_t:CDS:2, partial [Gigaspora margarita]
MLQVHKHKIDLDNLDFNRSYTLKEFEYINEQLKTRTLIVDGEPVNLFELDEKGHLIAIPQHHTIAKRLFSKSQDNLEIGSLVVGMVEVVPVHKANSISTSEAIGRLEPPDIAYTPKNIDRNLNPQQKTWMERCQRRKYFTLDIEMTPSETSESENDLEINCPECDETFTE